VWGDVGVGNFIYRGDEIVALTDFEQAHLGDPMKDIAAAIWRGIESIIPLDELVEVYEKRSGIRVDEESVAYYSVFIDAQYSATSGSVLRLFAADPPPDITFARMGLGIMYQCLDRGLRAVAAGLVPAAP
jgi:aminoglycoside phosphotransferase (APT) family kinase protein